MKLKLRSSVSIVPRKDNVIEFFKTNSREQVLIRSFNFEIQKFLSKLNGTFTLEEYIQREKLSNIKHEMEFFVSFLQEKGLLSNVIVDELNDYKKFRRPIHFIEDYSRSKDHLKKMWEHIQASKVVIIGLGAVGTWVAINLVQSGVKNLVLIDNDTIDTTNLHRQYGYYEKDVGRKKGVVLSEKLKRINSDIKVEVILDYLDGNLLEKTNLSDSDLIINCADQPNVDTTSLWVGEYCMKYKIPHIVGGGYNMHLSLIGQTVIPFESACIKCFEEKLKKINNIELNSIKKLVVKNRKIGSFGPMCSIIASFIGIEAIKVLTRSIEPANINRRGEFNIYTMDMTYTDFPRIKNCIWCGKE